MRGDICERLDELSDHYPRLHINFQIFIWTTDILISEFIIRLREVVKLIQSLIGLSSR